MEAYRHQVGGHSRLMKPKVNSSKVYKPFSESEYRFYEKLAGLGATSTDSGPLHVLKQFVPKYYGMTEVQVQTTVMPPAPSNGSPVSEIVTVGPGESVGRESSSRVLKYIILEDLVHQYKKPCVMDVKMGKRQRKIGASPEKEQRQLEKSLKTTSHAVGFRLCGCQYYDKNNDTLCYRDKYWGRKLSKEKLPQSIQQWFWNGCVIYHELAITLLSHLRILFGCISGLRHYRFWSSSLLWVFDGGLTDSAARVRSLDVKMIDFANTIVLKDNPSPDDEYLFGLGNLISILECVANGTPASMPPANNGKIEDEIRRPSNSRHTDRSSTNMSNSSSENQSNRALHHSSLPLCSREYEDAEPVQPQTPVLEAPEPTSSSSSSSVSDCHPEGSKSITNSKSSSNNAAIRGRRLEELFAGSITSRVPCLFHSESTPGWNDVHRSRESSTVDASPRQKTEASTGACDPDVPNHDVPDYDVPVPDAIQTGQLREVPGETNLTNAPDKIPINLAAAKKIDSPSFAAFDASPLSIPTPAHLLLHAASSQSSTFCLPPPPTDSSGWCPNFSASSLDAHSHCGYLARPVDALGTEQNSFQRKCASVPSFQSLTNSIDAIPQFPGPDTVIGTSGPPVGSTSPSTLSQIMSQNRSTDGPSFQRRAPKSIGAFAISSVGIWEERESSEDGEGREL